MKKLQLFKKKKARKQNGGYCVINDIKNPDLIKIINLSKSYGNNKVLKNINLTIKKNERVAIIGENGAGKTTLAEIIAQIKKFNKGSITYNFKEKGLPKERIGFQFQISSYPSKIRIKDIIGFYQKIYIGKIDKNILKLTLKAFDLEKYWNIDVKKLSGGQKQRLNILLAIFHKPELLILDELSSGLDIQSSEYIKKLITFIIKENKLTLLMVSHNISEMDFLCNRFIVIENGSIIFDLTKKEIKKRYKTVDNFINYYFFKYRKPIWKFEELLKK